jgi:hypothetical protein
MGHASNINATLKLGYCENETTKLIIETGHFGAIPIAHMERFILVIARINPAADPQPTSFLISIHTPDLTRPVTEWNLLPISLCANLNQRKEEKNKK